MGAIQHILGRMDERNTLVCAGIDPNPKRFPEEIRGLDLPVEEQTREFLRRYIEIVAPHACAFKAQKAYFDVLPQGHELLQETIDHAHRYEVPVIVDCKIGDIDETMKAYRRNLFDVLGADGVVVNPYMGDDVMLPLAEHPDKAVVVLVKTSNPGGSIVQDLRLASGGPLWREMLELTVGRWNASSNMIPVVTSTQETPLADIRAAIPADMPVFFAGVGAQGGSLNGIADLLDARGRGVLVNSSRGLMYPESSHGEHWTDAVHRSVVDFQSSLNAHR